MDVDVFGGSEKGVKTHSIYTKEQVEIVLAMRRDWSWYRNLLATCIQYGKPGKWLDLGAGIGLFVECAARFGIDCIGLEGSEYAIKVARKRFPGIDMRQHFLEDRLPFEDSSISTIVCNQTIEHLSSEVAAHVFRESYRVLVEQGALIISSPSAHNRRHNKNPAHINLYTPKRLRREIRHAGFDKIISIDSPRMIMGNCRPARYIMRTIFKVLPFDSLSATASCVAVKLP